jgi:hypothetical protein
VEASDRSEHASTIICDCDIGRKNHALEDNRGVDVGIGPVRAYDDKKVSVLGDFRKSFYQKVAKQSMQQSSKLAWPLFLRPAHRMLLAASLTSEATTLPTECTRQEADRFVVVDGFIVELSFVRSRWNSKARSEGCLVPPLGSAHSWSFSGSFSG